MALTWAGGSACLSSRCTSTARQFHTADLGARHGAPPGWTAMTAINTSTEAASIERLLETVATRLPRLILDAIDELVG
jgi:hypothetical protein